MLKRPSRLRESVGIVQERDQKVRRRAEVRRDELGEMREGMSPGVLVSRDFRTVNRHFSSAFENGLKRSTVRVSDYCQRIADEARASEDLAVKKLLFMTVLCLCPEVRKYYEANSPPEKFGPWFAALPGHIEDFVNGRKRDGVTKCARPSDAKYRSVAAFVGAMTASYVGM